MGTPPAPVMRQIPAHADRIRPIHAPSGKVLGWSFAADDTFHIVLSNGETPTSPFSSRAEGEEFVRALYADPARFGYTKSPFL